MVAEVWCEKDKIPYQCLVGIIVSFLQDLIDKGKAFSTVMVYLAANAACHMGFGGKTAGQHPLVCHHI